MADPIEARVCEAAEEIAVRGSSVARPINEHCTSDDEFTRDKAPIAAVFAVIAAVAHTEKAVWRDYHRLACDAEFIAAPRQVLTGLNRVHRRLRIINIVFIFGTPFLKLGGCESGLIIVCVADHAVFGQRLVVDKDLIITKLDLFAGKSNYSFDVVYLVRNDLSRAVAFRMQFIAGIFEDDNVTAGDLPLRQERQFVAARRKDEFIYK